MIPATNGPADGVPKANRIVRGAMFSFCSFVAIRIATLANSIVVVRSLGPGNFGAYSLILLTISFASTIAALGVPPALVKFLSSDPTDGRYRSSHLLGAGFALTLVSSLFASGVLAMLAPAIGGSLYGSASVSRLLVVASLGMLLGTVFSPLFSVFQGFELVREMSVRNIVTAILSIPVTLLLVFNFGLDGAVWATVINTGVAALVNLPLLRSIWRNKRLSFVIPRNRATYRTILGYALPALAGSLLVAPILWISNSILATQGTLEDVGHYAVAVGLSGYLLFIPSSIGIPLVPILSRVGLHEKPEFASFMTKTLRVSTFLLLPPTLVLIGFPDIFVNIVYGKEFIAAAPMVRILAPATFAAGVSSIVGYAIAGTGRMWHGLLLNLTWGTVFLASSLILVPSFLATGLAVSHLLSYVVLLIGAVGYGCFKLGVNFREVLPAILLASMAIVGATVTAWLLPYPWALVFSLGIVVLVVAAEMAMLGSRELQVLREPLRKLISWMSHPR